jgi:YbgC/YbaW family acyl-CoA thioester hydrolase
MVKDVDLHGDPSYTGGRSDLCDILLVLELSHSASQPFAWQSRIRFVDTDASGRIHYSAIFRHFEAAEFEFMRSIGHVYDVLDQAPLVYPRVHAECDYFSALRSEDLIMTQVTVERVGKSSFTLAFSVLLGDRKAGAGRITVVCTHSETGRAHPLPSALSEKLRERISA